MTIIAAYFLHLCACLTCLSVHASSLHPLLAHHHLCYVDVYGVFFCFFCLIFQLFLLVLVVVHIMSNCDDFWPFRCAGLY